MLSRPLFLVALGLLSLQVPAGECHAQGQVRDWLLGHDQRAADNDSYLQTDGPSFTRANGTVPQSMLQLETRYTFQTNPSTSTFPQLDLRYGLLPRLELRAEWGGVSSGPGFQSAQNLEVGFKYLTSNQQGWTPKTALMVELFTPTSGYSPNTMRTVSPEIDYIYGWTLTEKWGIGGSTGAIFGQPGAPSVTQYYQSAIVQWTPLDQNFNTFAEAYSLFGSGTSQGVVLPSLDAGALYRPGHNVQFDWRVGMNLNHHAQAFFTGGGVSVRY